MEGDVISHVEAIVLRRFDASFCVVSSGAADLKITPDLLISNLPTVQTSLLLY